MDNRPIGVFDSGLGGLTGVRELRKRLPHEDIIYFGDTGRVPYGSRSPETILQYARQDVAFLLSKNVKCIMAACGTVSSTYPAGALPWRSGCRRPGSSLCHPQPPHRRHWHSRHHPLPQLRKAAAAAGARGGDHCPCLPAVCTAGGGRVCGSQRSRKDTLILGCTHYPLLKSMIGEFMGPGVTLVDPAMTAAHHLERMLAERGLRASHESGQAHFYVSDVPDSFVQTVDLFLGEYKGGPVEQIAIDKY